MADLSALDEDREIRFVSPESSIGIAKIQKLIARSIFSSGMKRNFYRDQFLIFLKFIFLRLVSRKKKNQGLKVAKIHGDITPRERKRVMRQVQAEMLRISVI
ncbi:hypothetical protein EfmAA290_13080 [Enterococcus faecium]|nr:hypothetical protein EfmAA290_13080 [Enterococcus faecium]